MDQALHHPRPENAVLGVARCEHFGALAAGDQFTHVFESCTRPLEAANDFIRYAIFADTGRVVKIPEDQIGATFGILDIELLDIRMDRGLLGGAEAGAHIDAFSAQAECCYEAAAVPETA